MPLWLQIKKFFKRKKKKTMVLSREFQIKKRTNISIEENHRCQFLVIHKLIPQFTQLSLSAFGESLTCVEL
jgi:hypothetical protein